MSQLYIIKAMKVHSRLQYLSLIHIFECPEAAKAINAGDEVTVDFDSGIITDETTGEKFKGQALSLIHIQMCIRDSKEDGSIYFLPDDELPLVLPELEDYKGKNGKAPLENATAVSYTHLDVYKRQHLMRQSQTF